MKNILKYFKPAILCAAMLVMVIASCKKDNYYEDGGKANPVFNGNMLQYLESNSKFDTIVQIVKLANLEDVFQNEKITFFCPTDEVVRRTIGDLQTNGLNRQLFDEGKDTLKVLSDIQSAVWRKYLMRYIFKGTYTLKDYPQLDFGLKAQYPGSFYYAYNNDLANIGVVYNPVNKVNYTGYRQLSISYIPDPSNPSNFIPAAVASSDIQPSNGVVHVLAISLGDNVPIGQTLTSIAGNNFGFGYDFNREVILNR